MSFDQVPIDVVANLVFPNLSMIEQAHLSRVNIQSREAASRFYNRLFSSLGLSLNQKQLFEGIKNKNTEGLMVLIPQLKLEDFDRVEEFDPLFYAWLMGLNGILDEIFECMVIPFCKNKAKEHELLVFWGIRTYKSLDKISELLPEPRDLTFYNSYLEGHPLLWYACEYGHFEAVKDARYQFGSPFFLTQDKTGYTPITIAHRYGHYRIVRFLITKTFQSPCQNLEDACAYNNIGLVTWILGMGVILNKLQAGNILHRVIHSRTKNNSEITRLLLEERSVFLDPFVLGRAVWIASRAGRIEMLKVFIEKGAIINQKCQGNSLSDRDKKREGVYTTALEEALIKENYSAMVLLIIEGADVRCLFKDPYLEKFKFFMGTGTNYYITKRQIAIKILENYSHDYKAAENMLAAFNSPVEFKNKFILFDSFVFRLDSFFRTEMGRVHEVCHPFLNVVHENEPIMDCDPPIEKNEKPFYKLIF